MVLVLRDVFVSRRNRRFDVVNYENHGKPAGYGFFVASRHCERSEAIQETVFSLDCFVVPPRNDAKRVGAKRRLFPKFCVFCVRILHCKLLVDTSDNQKAKPIAQSG